MNKMLSALLVGVSLTTMVNTANSMQKYCSPYANNEQTAVMKVAKNETFSEIQNVIKAHPEQIGRQDSQGNTALMFMLDNKRLTGDQKVELIRKLAPFEAGMQGTHSSTALIKVLESTGIYGLTKEQMSDAVRVLCGKEAGIKDIFDKTAMVGIIASDVLSPELKLELATLVEPKEGGWQYSCGITALMMVIASEKIPFDIKSRMVDLLAPSEAGLVDKKEETATMQTVNNPALTTSQKIDIIKKLISKEAGNQRLTLTATMMVITNSDMSGSDKFDLLKVLLSDTDLKEAGKQNYNKETAMMMMSTHWWGLSGDQVLEIINILKTKEAGLRDNSKSNALQKVNGSLLAEKIFRDNAQEANKNDEVKQRNINMAFYQKIVEILEPLESSYGAAYERLMNNQVNNQVDKVAGE